jgi:hypothetical protein
MINIAFSMDFTEYILRVKVLYHLNELCAGSLSGFHVLCRKTKADYFFLNDFLAGASLLRSLILVAYSNDH